MPATYLGTLCKRGHDTGGAKSVRLVSNDSCLACQREQQRQWKIDNRDRSRAQTRKSVRKHRYRTAYGITPEDYDRMLAGQGGVCAICGSSEPGGRGNFHVDHDHTSGRVRGLLCNGCNLVLGHAQDDADRLEAAARYLRKP